MKTYYKNIEELALTGKTSCLVQFLKKIPSNHIFGCLYHLEDMQKTLRSLPLIALIVKVKDFSDPELSSTAFSVGNGIVIFLCASIYRRLI